MSVLREVEKALDGRKDWRAEVARALADQLDTEPNASTARELRALMVAFENEAPAVKGTALDRILQRRHNRESGADPGGGPAV